MATFPEALAAHLLSGETTLCRCWAITRNDGVRMGFTDHDLGLAFEGVEFRPDTGMTASTLEASTGLSVDNSEALGALSDAAITEADIEAGRFDGAEVRAWLVNWVDPEQRWLQFRGSIGELKRSGGAFQAELRGLTEALNAQQGRVYQTPCTAVLGDSACRFDTNHPDVSLTLELETVESQDRLAWASLPFEAGWFSHGRLDVMSGAAEGLWAGIKTDVDSADRRALSLWTPLRALVQPGDLVKLTAGCDKAAGTCRGKFDNLLNYQGFPDIPGEDWMVAYPRSRNPNTGGSRR